MNQFHVIAITHRTLSLEKVGRFHIEPDRQKETFEPVLEKFGVNEFIFLTTCNRVEYWFRFSGRIDNQWVERFFKSIYGQLPHDLILEAVQSARRYDGVDAIRHIFHVASSLDSMIVGEREIITQVKEAFQRAKKMGFTGDFMRIAINKAIETAKQVYTETNIASKPISVVNLGFRKLLNAGLKPGGKLVFVGAGKTIQALAGNLAAKSDFDIKVFNRTLKNAQRLAEHLGGEAYPLQDLTQVVKGFDVLVTCTSSEAPIITPDVYSKMIGADKGQKIVLDLALPADVSPDVVQSFNLHYIGLDQLKSEARENLKARENEIFRCEALVEQRIVDFEEAFKTRKLELAMAEVPRLMKQIRQRAQEQYLLKDLSHLSEEDKKKIEAMMAYMEKKYISIPMKIAREVVLDQNLKDPIVER